MIRWLAALMLLLFAWTPLYAADFKWMDEHGTTFSLDSLKGDPVLVHFWASWCPSCREEMPAFARWVAKHPSIKVLSVSLDQSSTKAADFLQANRINIPLLLSDDNQARKLGARALPTTIVIDSNGDINQVHRGPRNWKSGAFSEQLLKTLRPEGQSAHLHTQR